MYTTLQYKDYTCRYYRRYGYCNQQYIWKPKNIKCSKIKENYVYIIEINFFLKIDGWWIHKSIIFMLIHSLVPDLSTTPRTSIAILHVLPIWWTVCSTHCWLCRDTTVCNWFFFNDIYSWPPCMSCSCSTTTAGTSIKSDMPRGPLSMHGQIIASTHFQTIYWFPYWDGDIWMILFVGRLPNQ